MNKEEFIKVFKDTYESGIKEGDFSVEKHAEQFYDEVKNNFNTNIKNDGIKNDNIKINDVEIKDILLVEDGSVDTDALEAQGYKLIVYRQGSTPPYFINSKVR